MLSPDAVVIHSTRLVKSPPAAGLEVRAECRAGRECPGLALPGVPAACAHHSRPGRTLGRMASTMHPPQYKPPCPCSQGRKPSPSYTGGMPVAGRVDRLQQHYMVMNQSPNWNMPERKKHVGSGMQPSLSLVGQSCCPWYLGSAEFCCLTGFQQHDCA